MIITLKKIKKTGENIEVKGVNIYWEATLCQLRYLYLT